ncbi:hypothetical protein KR084_000627 [Drosophila pseudotakahashii]|nr:hypothetical protein KR084_000627 [Drosophila pseudotakahashii]
MDFLSAISNVGNTDSLAKDFAVAFLRAVTSDPHNWIVKVSHQFVGQCFHVLGLNFNVSVQAFSQTQDHPYRDDNSNYIFVRVPPVMQELDKFLGRLPPVLAQIADHLASNGIQGTEFDELTHPLSCYLRLVMRWIHVVSAMCANMQLSNSTAIDRYLCNPLARMSFSILCGLTNLLPKYEDFLGLKKICLLLAEDVRYAIFYRNTCSEVVPPMLEIFRKHHKTFCGAEKTALDFIYCVLTVMSEDDSYIAAYGFLETMIKQLAESTDENPNHYLRSFTNELIDVKYVVLQFGIFKESNSKPLLLATLKYLMTLQSNIASAECFSKRFHEVLLQLVLRMQVSSLAVASLAAELYIKLSQRQHQDRDIAQHILETYIKMPDNHRKRQNYARFRTELTLYLKALMQHFPPLGEFEFYAFVLNARNVRLELSLIAAQSASIVFEIHMAAYSSVPESRDQVIELLRCWPYLLQSPSRQNGTRPVLYSIYGMINFETVAELDAEMLVNLEAYCLDNFLSDETLSESEISNLYTIISRSVDATGNIQIHFTASRALRDEQAALQSRLNSNSEGPESQELLNAYAKSIRRLHGLLMAKKLHVRYVFSIYETLAKFVLETPTQNENITLYGCECLAAMLVLLHNDLKDSDDVMGLRISFLVQQLQDFCVSELSNANVDLKRAKFMVCSILTLHINQLPYSNLDSAAYDRVLEILILPPRELQSESVRLSSNYVSDMYFMFRELIKTHTQIVLPSNKILKVVSQYKMSVTKKNTLNFEIEELINDLMESQIESYVHCISLIQLQVYDDTNARKKASRAKTAHLKLIDNNCTALDSWLLRFIIFQDSLDLLVKNIRAMRMEVTSSLQQNRFQPLRQLLILVSNLRLQETHFTSIAKMVCILREDAVGPQEISEVESFITRISTLKYQAEDEEMEAINNENFEGKLKVLPPGPFNFWQYNTLKVLRDVSI